MTGLPANTVVNVGISVGAPFPALKGFGVLNAITAETGVIGIAERIRAYNDAPAVAAEWPGDSEIVKVANTYFGQKPTPTEFRVSVRFDSAQAAQLRGGAVSGTTVLAALTAIADASFKITLDGDANEVTALDLSDGELSYIDIAASIQTGLQAVVADGFAAATCTYTNGRFLIDSGTNGVTSTISFATAAASGTDISSLLQLRSGESIKTNGIAAENVTTALNEIEKSSIDFYGFLFTKEVRDGVQIEGENAIIAAANWAEGRPNKIFINTSNDADLFDSITDNDIASVLSSENYGRTMCVASSSVDQYPGASALGRAFTTNFDSDNSTITLKFKQGPTITTEILNGSQKIAMDAKNANAFIEVGGLEFFAEGVMCNGVFFDERHGLDWLINHIQIGCFGYLATRPTKVPHTDKGYAAVEQQLIQSLAQARRNGLLAAGTTTDGEFLPLGYKTFTVPESQVSQANKEARVYNGLSYIALGAGAIHGLQINGIFER